MITDYDACPPEAPRNTNCRPATGDPVSLLTRIYSEAGLTTDAALRCALADCRAIFPQFLAVGV